MNRLLDLPGKAKKKKPIRYYSPKRRAIYAQGDDIDALELFNMYDWICHLCRSAIDPRHRKPHPLCATIDHIIPLSRGGTHTWTNCAPAHAYCNFQKGDQVPAMQFAAQTG
jgi:5-methylcytosine-specific restriction endonuclease McrA